ncbi:hypothetical protein [Halomonas sp. YLGW01]|uniref:hypothetical protein n=1 Tax=Halomonas sp. YLGW01 TaxID=2773308 RepID=UPI001F5B9DE5|nr:hypothetical protein [Halomonas sp. YLGW01]
MKRLITTGMALALTGLAAGSAQAYDRTTLAAVAGTTGFGAELSYRMNGYLGVTASYTDNLDYEGDYDTDDVHYEGDLGIGASALKLNLYPFAGRFYLTAGAMLPDMEADVTGTSNQSGDFEFDGNTYNASSVGELQGKLTIADGVQPYLGMGWRSSHRSGFGIFGEFGVMSTDVEVELDATGPIAGSPAFERDARAEERRLEEEAEDFEYYPIAMLGISYTF